MLFMVIEQFENGDVKTIGERFRRKGRMLPVGVSYHASWIDAQNGRCFQIMEAPDRESLDPWIAAWDDLVDFDVVPVQTSADFWPRFEVEIICPRGSRRNFDLDLERMEFATLTLGMGNAGWGALVALLGRFRKVHSEILKQLQSALVYTSRPPIAREGNRFAGGF
jgi:hypothetical protein